MPFTHLHVHTEYSLLDGACRISNLVARAKELGQTSIAITDHGVMYGAVAFYKAAVEIGVKPIIGCEVYVAVRSRFDMEYDIDAERYHLVLLCRNDEGYRNLCRLVSLSFSEGYYIKPRIDMDILRQYSGGLIALSACLSGRIPKSIAADDFESAKAHALEMCEIFGDDGFYLELQDTGVEEQRAVNAGIIRLHDETGIPLVVTNDVHFITREDAYAQDVLMCMQTGKTLDDTDRLRFDTDDSFLKSEEEMRALFPAYPEACDNTAKVADLCNFQFDFSIHHLPSYPLPEGETDARDYLRRLCAEGYERCYTASDAETRERVRRQLDYELEMIHKMGFTDYMLIVWDIIKFAKSHEIPVGPGRGSAAGSIVSYCLDITTVDPDRFRLYFERFLNPERVSMPDIDNDFCARRREEVINYLRQRYGAEHVAQITTFNTLRAKAAVSGVAKVVGMTFAEERDICREVPRDLHITITSALNTSPRLREMYENDKRVKQVIETALELEDLPKASGTHAAGVVITSRPVMEYVPLALSKKDDSIQTQYNMIEIEELGLLKIDLLGLRYLTVIDDAVQEIRKIQPDFAIDKIPENDAPTYELLATGKTLGIFQLESQGMTAVSVGIKAKSIDDVASVIALYRPGPMVSIPKFVENSRNPEKTTYLHPLLEPILQISYGCIVYQEHILEILRQIAGYSMGQADLIRRAMSKKKQTEIEKERQTFIEGDESRGIPGALKNGVPRDVANRIYDEIIPFAGYGFNKAHAVAYAVIAYQTAYLKCHYPREYLAALLTSVLGSPEKIAEYAAECRDMGIALLPPDVNLSYADFSVSGNDIRYGLVAVKNIGRGFIAELIAERERNGAFESLDELARRLSGGEINRRALESLIKCGALDSFGHKRSQLTAMLEPILKDEADYRRRNLAGQIDLFNDSGSVSRMKAPDLPEYTAAEKMQMEHEVTGLYLSGHPTDAYRGLARSRGAQSIGGILADFANEEGSVRYNDGDTVTVLGAVVLVKTKLTKNNSQMAYVTLDDGTGTIECLVFQRILDSTAGYLRQNEVVLLNGKLSSRDDKAPQLVTNSIEPAAETSDENVQRAEENGSDGKSLYIKLPGENDPRYRRLGLVLSMFPGKDRCVVVFADTGKRVAAKCAVHDALLSDAREVFGTENVAVR